MSHGDWMSLTEVRRRLNSRWPFFIGLGLGLIGLELWFLPSEICEHNEKTGNQDCAVSNAASYVIWHFIQFLKDNATVLDVFSTVAIAIFTGVLWSTTHK